jgi:predicted TIM-barrel enzyme
MLVAHGGLTTAGTIGAAVALTVDEAIATVMAIAEAGRKINPNIFVICHGGPFDEPDAVGVALAGRAGKLAGKLFV